MSGSSSPALMLMETLLLQGQPAPLQHRQRLAMHQNGHSRTPVLTSENDWCAGSVKRWTGARRESGLLFLVCPQGTFSGPADPEGREVSLGNTWLKTACSPVMSLAHVRSARAGVGRPLGGLPVTSRTELQFSPEVPVTASTTVPRSGSSFRKPQCHFYGFH